MGYACTIVLYLCPQCVKEVPVAIFEHRQVNSVSTFKSLTRFDQRREDKLQNAPSHAVLYHHFQSETPFSDKSTYHSCFTSLTAFAHFVFNLFPHPRFRGTRLRVLKLNARVGAGENPRMKSIGSSRGEGTRYALRSRILFFLVEALLLWDEKLKLDGGVGELVTNVTGRASYDTMACQDSFNSSHRQRVGKRTGEKL